MSTKTERILKGQKTEKKFIERLNENSISYITQSDYYDNSTVTKKYSKYHHDKLFGDIFIKLKNSTLTIDVKGGGLSIDSINMFIGSCFAIKFNDEWRIFIRQDMKDFSDKNQNKSVILKSGDKGFYIWDITAPYMSYEKFNTLLKSKL